MIETEESRDGDLTAKINNNYLHSAYSPRKEAVKFYHNNKLEISRTIILLEPCLNYLSEVIRKNNSSAKIISIYCDQYFYTRDNKKSDFSFCFTANNSDLQFFLSKALNELDIESLKIIEWPPAKKFYSERCLTIKQILTQHIRELHGNITTTSGFGQKYFRNFLKNYLYTDYILSPVRSSKAVLIAGSGPGLKADLDFIKDNRNRITLLSLPSSLHFLQYNGIKPDLIISTDPGYYAALHLNGFEDIPVASPLTAAVPFNCLKKGLLAFSQNYFMEACVNNPAPALTLPQHGTVAGSALYLSNILTEGPIFISGFDFSYTDLLSHNRPHTFDNLIESSSSRSSPVHSAYFQRNVADSQRLDGLLRTNQALKTYAGWFAANSHRFNNNCYFLGEDAQAPGEFKSVSHKQAVIMLSVTDPLLLSRFSSVSIDERKNCLMNIIRDSRLLLKSNIDDITTLESGSDILRLLNNQIIFNLFLPRLLEFKRHQLNKKGKDVQNKAVSLINETINFLEDYLDYV